MKHGDYRQHRLLDVLVERQTLDPQRTWSKMDEENAVGCDREQEM